MDSECVNCDDLARENGELRARLAEVEAERDRWEREAHNMAWARDCECEAKHAAEARLAAVARELTPFADGCMGTGEYKLCHDMSEAVENALAAAAGDDR